MVEASSTLPSSQKLVGERLCEKHDVSSENEFDDIIHESEHDVKTARIELENESGKSDEMSGKKEEKRESELILSKNAKAFCFPSELTFALFSVSCLM